MKYHKLVRDRIPGIISRHGSRPVTRVLDAGEYRRELRKKLVEEVTEFSESDSVEELADILEVVYALAASAGVSQQQLEKIRQEKRVERGGFDQRIFLEEVISTDAT